MVARPCAHAGECSNPRACFVLVGIPCDAHRPCAVLAHRMLSHMQMSRTDWLQVARGTLNPAFWRGQLTTHPSYSWYLERVRHTVQAALTETGANKVILIGHSAGGWLARAFLGDSQWFVGNSGGGKAGQVSEVPNPSVAAVVTLGTPQCPPPIGMLQFKSSAQSCTCLAPHA
jgi:pimeloyl-ACP methyl ester carboxylesterase